MARFQATLRTVQGKKLHELFKHLTEAVTFINITLAVWLQHC